MILAIFNMLVSRDPRSQQGETARARPPVEDDHRILAGHIQGVVKGRVSSPDDEYVPSLPIQDWRYVEEEPIPDRIGHLWVA
jgi:hypothetical protein